MKRSLAVAPLVVLLAATACAKAASPPSGPPSPQNGTLRVTQTIQGPLYIEGSVGYVKVSDGTDVLFETTVPQDGLERVLPAGTYTLSSYQRICGGNCDNLGPPTDRCDATVTVTASAPTEAVVKLTPTANSCTIAIS